VSGSHFLGCWGECSVTSPMEATQLCYKTPETKIQVLAQLINKCEAV
jgi:hypothetical protein